MPTDRPSAAHSPVREVVPLRQPRPSEHLARSVTIANARSTFGNSFGAARTGAPAVGRAALLLAAAAIAALALLAAPTLAQGDADEEACLGGGFNPTPTPVDVSAVPIGVTSTTDEYFVLYVRHDLDGEVVEQPVSVTRGQEGTTMLAENVAALPKERYRVEKYLISDPADVDGDCIDDITELDDPVGMNPVNPAAAIELSDGAVVIGNSETFEALSHDPSSGESIVKFVLFGMDTDRPNVYFMNTDTYNDHWDFLAVVGLDPQQSGLVHGDITYYPHLIAPDGNPGVYVFWFRRQYPFSVVARSFTVLAASMPLLEVDLVFRTPNHWLPHLQSDLPLYRESRISLVFDEDIYSDVTYLALNPGVGYGRLRVMEPDERPHPRDIVIYEALPNELPRVAGLVSTVPQTPLSHVNLRAVQDGIPNAFIRDILDVSSVDAYLGGFVRYSVTPGGWSFRAATRAEVDAHYASSRPAEAQTPERDLTITSITALSEIGFDDWDAFGVKAANVAVLGKLGFPAGTVPDGFAIPFYFYDEFMKHNGFYDDIDEMLADEDFQTDFDTQASELKKLRKAIEKGETPEWIIDAIKEMNKGFPEGINRRYRSSTNNEDLPGFNGAGLYDSKSQKPSEDEEDLAKSLKEVYASLWNFRAFVERDFHRIDHKAAAMGILVHPSYRDELANGVAVSFDPIDGLDEYYYLNTQLGEDLVTNPEAHSVLEEIRLHRSGGYYLVLGTSNQVPPGQLLMSDAQLSQLGRHLEVIHDHFERLYNPAPDEPFAMEIEFKITSDNILAIKQARPWVFDDDSGGGGGGGDGGGGNGSGDGGGGGPPAPPASSIVGATPVATATEVAGDRLQIQRHDIPDASLELAIGSISANCTTVVMAGVIRDRTLGQTYLVVRRESDGRIVRRWVPPYSPLIYQIPWEIVNTQYTVPVSVVAAIPLDDQCPQPNLLVRRFDGGDDRIVAYDAELGQWRHVPDPATFQALGFYWCNVTAADAGFFERITLRTPYPTSNVPARVYYPGCQT